MTSTATPLKATITGAPGARTAPFAALRRNAAPTALAVGPALTVLGFALHPRAATNDAAFVEAVNRHAAQWGAAHLLIGLGLVTLLAGVGSVLRLAAGRGAGFLTAGTGAVALGALGMGYDAIGHGAVGYALAGRSDVSVRVSLHVQQAFEQLPFASWAGGLAILFPVGVILLGVGALRSRRVPSWTAALLLLGPVGLQIAGAGPLELLGAAPLALGFGSLAVATAGVTAGASSSLG